MTLGGSLWNGVQLYQGIWESGQHPGASNAAVRQWVVPTSGTWTISGVTGDYDGTGGNGVVVTIKKNNSVVLYTRTIPNGGGDVSYSFSETFTAGETVEFIVDSGGENSYDSTHMTGQMVLTVAPPPPPGPPAPPPPPGPPPPPPVPPSLVGNCVVQWNANGEGDIGFYRVYWGMSPGVYGIPLAVPLAANPVTTCKQLGITSAGTYYLAVAAVDHDGNEGTKSSEVTLAFTGSTPDVTAPGAPQNVSAQ